MKTGRGRWAREWDDAYGLLPRRKRGDDVDSADTNCAFAKAAAPLTEVIAMETHVDVNKAQAVAVIKRFDDTVAELAKRHNITRGAALLKIASSPDDAALWRSYREAQQAIGVPAAPTPEPAPVSPAFEKMQKKAAKLAQKEGISQASAFAKVYAARPDLAQADKQFFFTSESPAPVGKSADNLAFLNLCGALAASYPHLSTEQIKAWAMKIAAGAPPAAALRQPTRDAA